MTLHTLADAAHERHPFTGLIVAEAAGLRLRPGTPRSRFEQEVWDLSGLADAPVVMSAHRKVLDFTAIANPLWRQVARQYLLARLAPLHPAVATLPNAFRAPINPNSLWSELRRLEAWLNHLTHRGVRLLAEVGEEDCASYLTAAASSTITPGRPLAPATTAGLLRPPIFLGFYRGLLADCYRPDFTPWDGQNPDTIAGYTRPVGNLTVPVPDEVLGPLLANAFYLIETIGPPLALEAAAVRAAWQQEASSRRSVLRHEVPLLRAEIERRHQAGTAAPLLPAAMIERRQATDWDPGDRLLKMSWHSFVLGAISAMGHRSHLEKLRPELEAWVADCGLAEPWCRDAGPVARHQDGTSIPWAEPMSSKAVTSLAYAVASAGFFITSALCGMRASELMELRPGCRSRSALAGGRHRYRLTTRRIKGEAFGGVEDSWVVIEEVDRAIGIVEDLVGPDTAEPLFGRSSNTSMVRWRALRELIEGDRGRRLGLEPVPDGPVSPRALRRTLALAIAQRPHGLMAAKIALKHVSAATSEGYTERPGGHQAAFLAETAAAEQDEKMRLTIAAFHDYKHGVLPAGRGARDLIAAFEAADKLLPRHDPGPVTIVDERRIEQALKTKAASLHMGIGNYCWFTDPAKALCLQMAGTPDATEPLIGLCDSARCPQATHHRQHRDLWAEHAETTRTVFLGNPRLSTPERAKAKAVLERAERIITEIDTAGACDDR